MSETQKTRTPYKTVPGIALGLSYERAYWSWVFYSRITLRGVRSCIATIGSIRYLSWYTVGQLHVCYTPPPSASSHSWPTIMIATVVYWRAVASRIYPVYPRFMRLDLQRALGPALPQRAYFHSECACSRFIDGAFRDGKWQQQTNVFCARIRTTEL